MYYMTVIQPDGETTRFESALCPVSETIKEHLSGGWLEIVPQFETYGDKPCAVFCDEEGKLKGLEANTCATYLWYACLAPQPFRPDVLHGPVVIIAADTAQELKAL